MERPDGWSTVTVPPEAPDEPRVRFWIRAVPPKDADPQPDNPRDRGVRSAQEAHA